MLRSVHWADLTGYAGRTSHSAAFFSGMVRSALRGKRKTALSPVGLLSPSTSSALWKCATAATSGVQVAHVLELLGGPVHGRDLVRLDLAHEFARARLHFLLEGAVHLFQLAVRSVEIADHAVEGRAQQLELVTGANFHVHGAITGRKALGGARQISDRLGNARSLHSAQQTAQQAGEADQRAKLRLVVEAARAIWG